MKHGAKTRLSAWGVEQSRKAHEKTCSRSKVSCTITTGSVHTERERPHKLTAVGRSIAMLVVKSIVGGAQAYLYTIREATQKFSRKHPDLQKISHAVFIGRHLLRAQRSPASAPISPPCPLCADAVRQLPPRCASAAAACGRHGLHRTCTARPSSITVAIAGAVRGCKELRSAFPREDKEGGGGPVLEVPAGGAARKRDLRMQVLQQKKNTIRGCGRRRRGSVGTLVQCMHESREWLPCSCCLHGVRDEGVANRRQLGSTWE